ncbi:MAG: DUF1131 family protein [Burkholderiales bacterium]
MKPIAGRVMASMLALTVTMLASASGELQITENGVGPIGAATRFNQKAIQQLLPGYTVTMGKRSTEGESYRVILVARQGKTLATINPAEGEKGIFSIRVRDKTVVNRLGPAIGASYTSIFGTTGNAGCSAGQEELSGKVICPHPKSRRVAYLLSGKYNGPDGRVPPMTSLKNFVVEEIVWRP